MQFTECCVYDIDATELAPLNELLKIEGAGLVIFAISGHEQYAAAPTNLDHGCGLLRGGCERLLTQYVFACLCGLDCQVRVLTLWSSDVYCAHLRVGQARGEGIVSVMGTDLKLPRQLRPLFQVPANECYKLGPPAIGKRGQNRALRDSAKAHYGKSNLPLCNLFLSDLFPRVVLLMIFVPLLQASVENEARRGLTLAVCSS